MDVVEMDAASNRRIDDIRDLRDKVIYPPALLKYKVYIIDEAHMITNEGFNALLKIMEEPPSHLIFILATTELEKIPQTILSRCQRFDFKRINNNEITGRLRKIVNEQNALADDKSLNLIARVSDGAMRDALSILDQAISMGNGSVEYDILINMLGLVTNDHLFNLTNSVIQRNVEKSISIIDEVVYAGKDIYLFIKDLVSHYRNILMAKVTHNPEEVLDMSEENIGLIKEQASKIRAEEVMRYIRILQEAEGNAKLSKQARLYLELAIIKMCKIEYDTSNEVILSRINKLEEGLKNGSLKVVSAVSNSDNSTKNENIVKEAKKEVKRTLNHNISGNENSKVTLSDIQRSWKDILERFKARRKMIVYASMVTGKPIECKNGILTIEYEEQYKFNKDRLEKPENRAVIQEVLAEIFREDIKIVFEVEEASGSSEKSTEDMLIESLGSDMVDILDE